MRMHRQLPAGEAGRQVEGIAGEEGDHPPAGRSACRPGRSGAERSETWGYLSGDDGAAGACPFCAPGAKPLSRRRRQALMSGETACPPASGQTDPCPLGPGRRPGIPRLPISLTFPFQHHHTGRRSGPKIRWPGPTGPAPPAPPELPSGQGQHPNEVPGQRLGRHP